MQTTPNRTLHHILPALLVLIAALAWQAGAGASAQRPPAQPVAVATVDVVTIFEQLQELKDLEVQLDKDKQAKQAQLDEVGNQLKTIRADLEAIARGTDEYKEKFREYMEKQAVIKARSDALNSILSIDRGNLTRELFMKISSAIERIAEREGYDIVLFDDSSFVVPEDVQYQDVQRAIVTRSVLYRSESIDITKQVIDLMNNEYTAP